MALKEFTEKSGHPIWISAEQIAAIGTIYTDGTETGEADEARPIAYVLLINGATFHLNHSAEAVANRIMAA